MKRSFLLSRSRPGVLVAAGTGLIAATYGLVRLAFGLFLPDVQAELGVDVAMAGAISGGASLVYCVGAIVGFLSGSRHARALVVASTGTAGAGALGMALAPSAPVFAVFAIVGSAGAGLASPALVALLQSNLAEPELSRRQSVVNAGTGPGLVGAGVLALVLLPDWRTAWIIAAVVTAAVGILTLASDGGADASQSTRRPLPSASWYAAHGKVIAAALLMGAGSAAVWTYGRTLLVESESADAVSIVAWIALGAGGSAVIVTARWTDRASPRALWAATAGLVGLTTLVAGLAASVPPLMLAACAVFGWAYTAGTGALIGWTTRIDAERAPTGTALLFVTLILGQAGGAVLVGALVADGGYAPAFAVAAAVGAVSAVFAGARPKAQRPSPPIA